MRRGDVRSSFSSTMSRPALAFCVIDTRMPSFQHGLTTLFLHFFLCGHVDCVRMSASIPSIIDSGDTFLHHTSASGKFQRSMYTARCCGRRPCACFLVSWSERHVFHEVSWRHLWYELGSFVCILFWDWLACAFRTHPRSQVPLEHHGSPWVPRGIRLPMRRRRVRMEVPIIIPGAPRGIKL